MFFKSLSSSGADLVGVKYAAAEFAENMACRAEYIKKRT